MGMDVVKYLDRFGEWEIYSVREISKSVKIERGQIKTLESSDFTKFAVRVIVNGRVGFATANELSLEVCEKAVKIARVSEEKLKGFPNEKPSRVEGIYDKRVETATPEKIFECVEEMLSPALELKVNPSSGFVEFSCEEVKLINSSGVELSYKSTLCSAFLECVYRNSSGFEMDESRMLNVDFEFIGRKSAELALESVNPQKVEGVYDVALSPIAIHELLSYTLYPAISLENVLKGKSPLTNLNKDYLGNLTIVDDGTLDYGLMSAPFDDEGVSTREKTVFENGVLKSYITDLRHANLANVEPSGNGFRGDDLYPTTSPTNVVLEFDEFTDNYDNCVYVHAFIGAHTSNPVSGDFSLELLNAFLIKNGEKKPVRAMLYGNVYDLLNKISAFCRDVRQIENTVTPTIVFESVKLV